MVEAADAAVCADVVLRPTLAAGDGLRQLRSLDGERPPMPQLRSVVADSLRFRPGLPSVWPT